MSDLKKYVTGTVCFEYYRDRSLWYKTQSGLLFAVPISDAGSATFKAQDKGLLFMRWIRAALKEQSDAKQKEGK